MSAKKASDHPQELVTLAIDIGGTGIKMMALSAEGKPLTERWRVPTPQPPTPKRILKILDQMKDRTQDFDRVSVGYPGVIKHGITLTAANLNEKWLGFPLQKELEHRWKRPVRIANDAAIQGYAAIKGRGVEMILTLGTGLGSALYTDGHLCPGLELAHHPWRKGKTYEEFLGRAGLKKVGHKQWNHLVGEAIVQTEKLFNWDKLYIGGGNAKKLAIKLGPNISIVSNEDGLLGGAALWRDEKTLR
jgi:polyphosphate glucokinase